MPKLHDSCQILLEDAMTTASRFRIGQRAEVLALMVHAVEEDLHRRHPDATTIAQHLWVVLNELIDRKGHNWPLQHDSLDEGDMWAEKACEEAVWSARRLFPSQRFAQY